jgi:hypothetical protein
LHHKEGFFMKSVSQVNVRSRGGDVVSAGALVRALAGVDLVKKIFIGLGCLALAVLGCWGLGEFMARSSMESASGTIATSVNSTRRLYGSIPDVGEGSVMISLVLAHQYDANKVSVEWREGGYLAVRNKYGGKLDVVALRNHFELHFYGVPKDVCPGLVVLYAYEKTGMPVWVNTIPVATPSVLGSAQRACSAQTNNLVWKFR